MNLEVISIIVQLLTAVAVIFSLIYVGKEIALNNRNQRLNALQTHNEAFRENMAVTTTHAGTWVAGLEGYPDLSASENVRFGLMIHGSFRHIEMAHLLHEEGVLDEETYRKSMRLIISLLAYPGGRRWWAARKQHFKDDFVVAVEAFLVADEQRPMYEYAIAETTTDD